jgi:hypothetical protein
MVLTFVGENKQQVLRVARKAHEFVSSLKPLGLYTLGVPVYGTERTSIEVARTIRTQWEEIVRTSPASIVAVIADDILARMYFRAAYTYRIADSSPHVESSFDNPTLYQPKEKEIRRYTAAWFIREIEPRLRER